MAVLARDEIWKAIDAGDINVVPFDRKSVGCATIVLTVSNEFRVFKLGREVIPVKEDTDFRQLTEKVVIPEGEAYLLLPGTACLGCT